MSHLLHPPPRPMIKICGLTSRQAVEAAVEAGADALGFVFAPSPRQVSAEQAAEWVRDLPAGVLRVAVFCDPSAEQIEQLLDRFPADLLQADRAALRDNGRVPLLPVLRDGERLERGEIPDGAWMLYEGRVPGSGERADWGRAAKLARHYRLALAGGLNSGNVAQAIAQVRPAMVDVSSGVETEPGLKSRSKIAAFVSAVDQAAPKRSA